TETRRNHAIVHEIRGYPEVEQYHSTTGTWDLVIQLRCRNLSEFDLALERVRAIPGVTSTQTSLLFSSLRTA
ncbi:MAG: Lrp/AsnC ligand binding domain-containing protein, partial [Brachybacterium sp.]|nr:Lrp/AsnC ligand binding domain-containing protein [Brachybacterium sp.]